MHRYDDSEAPKLGRHIYVSGISIFAFRLQTDITNLFQFACFIYSAKLGRFTIVFDCKMKPNSVILASGGVFSRIFRRPANSQP